MVLITSIPASRYGIRAPLRAIVLLLASSLALIAPVDSDAEPVRPASEIQDPIDIQGYLSGRYVSRRSRTPDSVFRDEDAFGELRLDISKPSTNTYEFHYFGTLRDELSKSNDRRYFSPYGDIGNTYRANARGITYEAHLDLNAPFARVSQIRIGRQDGTREEPVFFDGIAADLSLGQKVRVTAYGGAAVHFFEIDDRWGADRLGGLGLDFVPVTSTSVNVDYLYLDDRWNLFDPVNHHNHLVSVKLTGRFTPNLKTTAKLRYVNDKPRDVKFRLLKSVPFADMELQAVYFRQFRVQNELATELSPLYGVIGQSLPYQSADVRLRKFFGARVAADVGFFQRTLLDQQQESLFNRTYRRTYAVLDFNDIMTPGLSFSFTGEKWTSLERGYRSSGFDAAYAFKRGRRTARFNVGTYASLYKYDDFSSLGERTTVRTNYVKFEFPIGQKYTLNGGYELEHGLENYQTARLGMRYAF